MAVVTPIAVFLGRAARSLECSRQRPAASLSISIYAFMLVSSILIWASFISDSAV